MATMLVLPDWQQNAVSRSRVEMKLFVEEFFRRRPSDVQFLEGNRHGLWARSKICWRYDLPNSSDEAFEMAKLDELVRSLDEARRDLDQIGRLLADSRRTAHTGTRRYASRLFHDFSDYDDYLARNVMAQLLANVVGPAALPDLIRSASKTPDATSEQMAPMIEVICSHLFRNRKKAASFVDALLAVPHPDMQDLGEYIAHRFGLRGQRAAARNRPRRVLRPRAAG